MFNLQLFGFYPEFLRGRKGQTDVKGVTMDRGNILCFSVPATKAVALSANGVHAAMAQTNAVQNIITGITYPAVPRNLTIAGNAVGNAGNVVITGTNYKGDVITETFALNGSTTVTGSKAFKTITNIQLPAETHAGTDTVVVGWGNKLGLPFTQSRDTLLFAHLNNVKEGTPPTLAMNATVIESNTVTLNSALNGTKVDVCFIVS